MNPSMVMHIGDLVVDASLLLVGMAIGAVVVMTAAIYYRQQRRQQPLDMLLWCPQCGKQHTDKPDPALCCLDATTPADEFCCDEPLPGAWTNPPHCSHTCASCGTVWRPADFATNGVAAIATKGKADTYTGAPHVG